MCSKYLNTLELIISKHREFSLIEDISIFTSKIKIDNFKSGNNLVLEKLLDKKSMFYDYIDKVIFEVMDLFNNQIINFDNKTIVYFSIYNSLFINFCDYCYYNKGINGISNSVCNNEYELKLDESNLNNNIVSNNSNFNVNIKKHNSTSSSYSNYSNLSSNSNNNKPIYTMKALTKRTTKLVLNSIINFTTDSIKKLVTIISADIWRRVPLKDTTDFFCLNKLELKIPFHLKCLIFLFNTKIDDISVKDDISNDKNSILNELKIKSALNFDSLMEGLLISFSKKNVQSKDILEKLLGIKSSTLNNIYNSYSEKVINNDINNNSNVNIKHNLLNKDIDSSSLIFTSSAFSLINYSVDLMSLSLMFDDLSYEILSNTFKIIDFYILSSLIILADKHSISLLYDDSIYNFSEILQKKPDKLDYLFETGKYHQKYKKIKVFIDSTLSTLRNLFSTNIEIPYIQNQNTISVNINLQRDNNNYNFNNNISNNNGNSNDINKKSSSFNLPILNSEIIYSSKNVYSLVIEKIIFFESVRSIKRLISRFSHLFNNINNNDQKKAIEEKSLFYKGFLIKLNSFLYFPICKVLYKTDLANNKLLNFKWDACEDSSRFSEINSSIEDMYMEVCSVTDKIVVMSTGSLTNKSKTKILESLFSYVSEILMGVFSQIKKCNSTGRSLMLKDIKFLKQRISETFALKNLNSIFSDLELYINAWYFNEEELFKHAKRSMLCPREFSGLVYTGEVFSKYNKSTKKEIIKKFESAYLDLMELFKLSYYS